MDKKQSEKYLSSSNTEASISSLSAYDFSRIADECFSDRSLIFGLYLKNNELCEMLSASAKQTHLSSVLNIPCKKGPEALSVTIKSSRVDILLTDMLENIWGMAEFFGPPTSLVIPFEIGNYRFWKVSFRNLHDSSMVRRK